MKAIRIISRILDTCTDWLAYLAGAMIVFVMISIGVDVVLRFFFNKSLIWEEDVTNIILLYLTFFGTAYVLKRNGHIAMDTVVTHLSPGGQRIVNIATSIVGLAICCVIFWYGTKVTIINFQQHYYESTVMQFPLAPILLCIPIGAFLMIYQFIKKIYGFITQKAPV